MKPDFSRIKSLKMGNANLNLPFLEKNELAEAYFSHFVRKQKYKIGDFMIDNKVSILGQFGKTAPSLAEYGFIQVALSYYAERYIVDIKTGRVFACETPMLAHELYVWWKEGRKQDLTLLLEGCAEESFENLFLLFKYIDSESA